MSDPKPPGASGNVNDYPAPREELANTGRVRLAVHEEMAAKNSELLLVLRRWWLIAITVAAAVWGAAGYLGEKASAHDVETIKTNLEHLGNRVTAVEQLKEPVKRIEAQVYELALRSGARVVSQPAPDPSPLLAPPLR